MALLSGLCAGKVIAGVVAIGATSFLGYNWVTTGCPTGVCPTERAAQATMTPTALAAAAEVEGCCALTAETATSACAVEAEACLAEAAQTGCCSADKAEQTVAVTTVAATLPAAPEGQCCSDKGLPEPCSEQKACCIENYNLADKTTTP